MSTGRALLITALLALCIAVWEIDPRWITENDPELTTLEQSEANKNALGGSQGIAWLAAPATGLLAAATVGGHRRASASTATPAGDRARWFERNWLGAWIAWSLVGAVFSPSIARSLVFTASFAVIAFAARRLTQHRPLFTAAAMVAGLATFVVVSLVTRFLGYSSISVRSGRLTLLSLEANQFGRMASFGAFAGLYLAFTARFLPLRVAGGTAAAAALAAVAMTGSRTGFAATTLALTVLLLLFRNRTVVGVLGAAGLVAAVLLSVTNVGQSALGSLTRASNPGTGAISTLTGRTEIWPIVIDLIEERPLSGHGFGVDTLLLSPRSVEVNFIVEHAHNAVLHLLLTTGAVGTILFLVALAAAVRRAPPEARPWVAVIVTYLLVAGVAEALFRNPDITLVGLVFALTLAARAPDRTPRRLTDPLGAP